MVITSGELSVEQSEAPRKERNYNSIIRAFRFFLGFLIRGNTAIVIFNLELLLYQIPRSQNTHISILMKIS